MIKSINPATGELLWEGQSADQAEIDVAVKKSTEALSIWSQNPIKKREELILRFGELLKLRKDQLALTISKEMGKPLWESKTEVGAMIGKVQASIDAQRTRCPEKTTKMNQICARTRHKPIGVCAVFGPYNFPAHLPNGHIIPALLAGNTVILKPSELTPLVSERVLEIWKEARMPEGLISIVQGGSSTGQILSKHSGIHALFFTGSWRTGKILSSQFGRQPDKLLALEMGGNNPLILGKINDIKAAAYSIVQSAYLTSGQRCTCARRLILQKQHLPIIKLLMEWLPNIKIGAYDQSPEPFMGPVVSNETATLLLESQEKLINLGAKPLHKMERLSENIPLLSTGLLDVTTVSQLPDEEIFGPLLQIQFVENFSEAILQANRTAYGLAASLLSDDPEQYQQFYRDVRAGVINWNRPTTGAASTAPFGGVGQSGNYRPSAFYAADYCNYPVASLESETLTLPETLSPGITL